MRIVITGGAGFVGSNLVDHLARIGGYEIAIIDNLSVGIAQPKFPTGVKFVKGEYFDSEILADLLPGRDAIVHLAALSGVIDSVADPAPSLMTNVFGSFRLLEAARNAGVKR